MNLAEPRTRTVPLPCVVCGRENGTKWRFHIAEDPSASDVAILSIARCARCGHIYQCPQADKSFAERYYDDAYETTGEQHAYWDPALKREHAGLLLREVRRHHASAASVLDVGAGMGAFVAAARDAGLKADGTEMAPKAVKKANELFGVSLHLGSLDTMPGDEHYDCVVLWDVIEHCPRPDLMIQAVGERLRPNGKLILTTGNYDSYDRITDGTHWWCWSQDHYHYFTPQRLAALAMNYGLVAGAVSDVPRIAAPAHQAPVTGANTQMRKSKLRYLDPKRIWRACRWKAIERYARWRFPVKSNPAIMLCVFSRPH